jgi:hypothetical protein
VPHTKRAALVQFAQVDQLRLAALEQHPHVRADGVVTAHGRPHHEGAPWQASTQVGAVLRERRIS